MRITGPDAFSLNSAADRSATVNYKKPGTVANTDNAHPESRRSPNVSISGEGLMRQRLFGVTDPNSRLPMQSSSMFGRDDFPIVNYLNQGDRKLISKAYEYAQEQGADLCYVDTLGRQLARYREPGITWLPHNQGGDLDGEGHVVSFSFTDKEAAIAKRILSSDALKTTQLDHGFIRNQMDKDYSAISHSDFAFMEKIINKFSATGDDKPLGSTFSKCVCSERNYIQHVSKERYRFTEKGLESLGTAAGNKSGKGKGGSVKQQVTGPPETLRETLRRIIYKAMSSNTALVSHFKNAVPSLAEFLMRNRR